MHYENCQKKKKKKWAIIRDVVSKRKDSRAPNKKLRKFQGQCRYVTVRAAAAAEERDNENKNKTRVNLQPLASSGVSFTWVLPLKFDGAYRNFEGSSSSTKKNKK